MSVRQDIREAFAAAIVGAQEGDEIVTGNAEYRVETPTEALQTEPQLGLGTKRVRGHELEVAVSVYRNGTDSNNVLDLLDADADLVAGWIEAASIYTVYDCEHIQNETELLTDEPEVDSGVLTMTFLVRFRTLQDDPSVML